jgi:pimeloyl-ACP methyl ester carboxylesterase
MVKVDQLWIVDRFRTVKRLEPFLFYSESYCFGVWQSLPKFGCWHCARRTYYFMKVYFISGLAADKRVFKYIQLPPHFEIVHLDWIEPLKKESLQSYSSRLAEKIDTNEPFALLGLSMGGMIAAEIASKLAPAKTILISSVPVPGHLPVYFKWAAKINLHRLVPVSLVKSASIMKRLFTAETPEDKQILKQIIRESDPKFIRWAMDAILHWKTDNEPIAHVHIHGSRDEVLPLRFTRPTHAIKNGGHLMVLNHAAEINAILYEVLSDMIRDSNDR